MSNLLRQVFKKNKVCLHRIVEARVMTMDIVNIPCKINILYHTLPYVETSYKFFNRNNTTEYIPYDKIEYDLKTTALQYSIIDDVFIDDIEFLLNWDIKIITGKGVKELIKKNIDENKFDASQLLC